ncbi:MAG TPA: hypothetical protein VHE35_10355 [Kofleriaceae bacterium]|nr:hypothetical protein [Kofleriaceae bacterium]
MATADALEPGLGRENTVQLERLRRVLTVTPGFQIVLLEVPEHPIRRRVVDRVLGWSAAGEIAPLRHIVVDATRAESGALIARLGAASTGALVEGLDSLFVDDDAVDRSLGALNWYREQLRRLDGPLILLLSPRGVSAMMARAPDFATWRSHTARISVPAPDAPEQDPLGALLVAEPDPLDLDVAEAALDAARARGTSRDLLVSLWLGVAAARDRVGDRPGGLAAVAAAAELGRDGVAPTTTAALTVRHAIDDLGAGRWSEAASRLATLDESVESRLAPSIRTALALVRAELAYHERRWDDAVLQAREAVRLSDQCDLHRLRIASRLRLVMIEKQRGDLEAATSAAADAIALAATPIEAATALYLRSDLEVAQGRPDQAIATLAVALDRLDGSAEATSLRRLVAHRRDDLMRLAREGTAAS